MESNVIPINEQEQVVTAKGNVAVLNCDQQIVSAASEAIDGLMAPIVSAKPPRFESQSAVFPHKLLHCAASIACMLACISLAGCGTDLAPPPESFVTLTSSNSTTEHRVWDCGIVVPGQPASISFPLEDPAIRSTSDIDVESVKTSCECIVATPFDYIDSHGKSGVAVRLDINESAEAYAGRKAGMLLGVSLFFKTRSGADISKVVELELVVCDTKRPDNL